MFPGNTLTPSSRNPPMHYCYPPIQPAPMNTLAHLPPLWIFAIASPDLQLQEGRAVPVGPSWFAAANLVMEGRRPRDYLHIHSLLLCYVVTPTRQGNDLKRLMLCTFPLDNCNSFMFLEFFAHQVFHTCWDEHWACTFIAILVSLVCMRTRINPSGFSNVPNTE